MFPVKSYTECGRETSPKFEYISGSIVWSFIQFVLIVCQVGVYQNILKLTCKPLAFTSS